MVEPIIFYQRQGVQNGAFRPFYPKLGRIYRILILVSSVEKQQRQRLEDPYARSYAEDMRRADARRAKNGESVSAVHETAVALRLRGEGLDPRTITALLGAEPTLAARKNDTWHTPNGKAVVARQGFWHLETERLRPGDLNVQIASILGQLTDDLGVWRQLTSTYRADLFCGLFLSEANQGIGIGPETLVITGQRGLRLDLDIYRQD